MALTAKGEGRRVEAVDTPIRGDRELSEDDKTTIGLHLEEIKALGFEPREVLTSKNGFTKYICGFVSGDLPRSRLTLQQLGFDLTAHREGGQLAGWAIIKRTEEGKGWR
jgi:hypothetical protein